MKRILTLLILACSAQAMEPEKTCANYPSVFPAEIHEKINQYAWAYISEWPILKKLQLRIVNKPITLTNHDNLIICLTVKDNLMISGSFDKTIKVWNLDRPHDEPITLTRHTARRLTVKYNLIISGFDDGTIKLRNLDRPHDEPITLTRHTAGTLTGKDNLMISGSDDGTIKLWNIETGKCKHTLTSHNSPISHLIVKDNLLISASHDGTIKLWNLDKLQDKPITLTGHNDYISCLTVKGNFLISASFDGTIKLWDLEPKVFEKAAIQNLPIQELLIFKIIQDEVIKNSDESLCDDLCDAKRRNPLQKAKLYKAYELAAALENTGLFQPSSAKDNTQASSSNNDIN